jgi:hypothetical protein
MIHQVKRNPLLLAHEIFSERLSSATSAPTQNSSNVFPPVSCSGLSGPVVLIASYSESDPERTVGSFRQAMFWRFSRHRIGSLTLLKYYLKYKVDLYLAADGRAGD